jgi:Xaa-Pro aminopeptidase
MVAGKPFLIDAVSNYRGYMGDFARTFIIGEPSKEVEMRRRANQLARDAVFDAIKPGVKFDTLRKIGLETMIKNGMPDYAVFVTPHSVGLQHGDNPYNMAELGVTSFDHVLQENMVLTVDLPYLEVGYGCGHNEDLFRVTKTGYEALNTEEDPFIVL